jgi:hypothetical protein
MSRVQKITLDTRYSINSSTDTPVWLLNSNSQVDQLTGFQCGNFCGVNSIYNIDSRNNKISLYEHLNTTGSTRVLTIPEGEYTIDTLQTELLTQLNGTSGSYNVTSGNLDHRMVFSKTSGSFSFQSVPKDMYYELGLNSTQVGATIANSITAGSSYDLSGIKKINVVSSSFGLNYCDTPGNNFNTILSIPVQDAYGSAIYSPQQSDLMITSDARNVNNVSISLYDERYRYLSNMRDWSLDVFLQSN